MAGPTWRRRGLGEVDEPLPEFLDTGELEVLDDVEVSAVPGRRSIGGGSASRVQLTAQASESDLLILVARHPSGALAFHRPSAVVARRGAEAGRRRVVFDVPVIGSGASERRGPISRLIRLVLLKVADAVAGALLEHAAQWAVPRLAVELEKRLWKGQPLDWLKVSLESIADDGRPHLKALPDFPEAQRGLLLLHGTFSSSRGSFHGLASSGAFADLRQRYGDNIYAFDHFSISQTPEENGRALLDAMPPGVFEFDILTHSRGGLVARSLLEGLRDHPHRERLKVGNVVMVACPSLGTPLAGPQNWDQKLSLWANILELLPAGAFTTAGAWLMSSLQWVSANVLGNCPGLVAMDPDGDFIRGLEGPGPKDRYYALTSNFVPGAGMVARLGDLVVDGFFGAANDLVVPTGGGWKTGAANLAAERVACRGLGGNLGGTPVPHHCGFFTDAESVRYVLSALRGEPTTLPLLDLDAALPFGGRRGAPRLEEGGDATDDPHAREVVSESGRPSRGASASSAVRPPSEDALMLTIISGHNHVDVEEENEERGVPIMVATYGSARVTEPFYVSGRVDDAGLRWRQIIAMQRFIVAYANGKDVRHALPQGEIRHPTPEFLEAFGEALFRALFVRDVRNLYNIARFQHTHRRLNLIFTSMIPWVADIPWELAYDRAAGSFLSCGDVRFIRNVFTPTPANRVQQRPELLRILVVSAQPLGFGRLSIEDERRNIRESFRSLIDADLAEVEVLAAATPRRLHERLRYGTAQDQVDILHFIGHGEFNVESRTGFLFLEDEGGRPFKLSAESFLNIVRGRGIQVIFLNACETGRGERADYNRGVAMALARDGMPAVVANQYSVIDRSASFFSLHFYACLARGLSLADAMREARIAVQYCGMEPMDWGVPVLFSSFPDARLREASGAERGTPPAALDERPLPSGARRSGALAPTSIVVWDAENALVFRENLAATLQQINDAQDSFVFRVERFSAPRSFWAPDRERTYNGVAYLRSESVAPRLKRFCDSLGTDYLFCITELPLQGDGQDAIYFYDSEAQDGAPAATLPRKIGKIAIFSTWNLSPALEGLRLKRALANHLAIHLLDHLAGISTGIGDADLEHPVGTVSFYNDLRSVEHIAAHLSFGAVTRAQVDAALAEGKISQTQLDAIMMILGLFH